MRCSRKNATSLFPLDEDRPGGTGFSLGRSKEIPSPRICRRREFLGRSHALDRKLNREILYRPAGRTFEGNIGNIVGKIEKGHIKKYRKNYGRSPT